MTRSLTDFQQMTINDLEREKFCLDSNGNVAVRWLQGISSRGNPVETWADLPVSGTINGEAIVVRGDPVLGSTVAIWNGTARAELNANDYNRVAIDSGDMAGYLGTKILAGTGISIVTSAGPNKTMTIATTSAPLSCADVKDCIENFTDLDLSGLSTLVLGGDITFAIGTTIDRTNATSTGTQDFANTYIANYDGSTINIINNATMNVTDSTTNYDNSVTNYTNNSITNYDSTTVVNMDGDTNITNLTVQNISVTGTGAIAVSGTREEEIFDSTIPTGNVCALAKIPVDANGLFVFRRDTKGNYLQTLDYTYNVLLNTVNLVTPLTVPEEVLIKYMVAGNISVAGLNNEAYVEEFIATPGQTVFTMAHDAIGTAWIRVSGRSGLYEKQGGTRDYTMTASNEITLTSPAESGDIITIQYISDVTMLAKATTPEAIAGTEDTHYMTPAKTKDAILALAPIDPLTPTAITANGTGIYTSIATKPRQVFKNGLYMLDTLDYTYTSTTLTFAYATATSDTIVVID